MRSLSDNEKIPKSPTHLTGNQQTKLQTLAGNLLMIDEPLSVTPSESSLLIQYRHDEIGKERNELLRLIAMQVGSAGGAIEHLVDDGEEVRIEVSLKPPLPYDCVS